MLESYSEGRQSRNSRNRPLIWKNDIAAWEAEYDAHSPDVLRERATADDVSAEQAYEFVRIASDWELAQYRLSLVQNAIENYDTWTSDPSSITV